MAEMGTYVERFLAANGMTRTELARTLGYRSKTSLNRIMEGSTRPDGVRDFERRMSARFPLSAAERGELHDAVTIAIQGRDAFRANRELWRFIRGEQPCAADGDVWVRDAGGGPRQRMSARWGGILGCGSRW